MQQVFRLERQRTIKGKPTTEIAYGITSLARTQADAAALLALVRGPWSIENNLFGIRDTTFGEDAGRVRTGYAPQDLAAIRNVAITLLNRIDGSNKAATLRRPSVRGGRLDPRHRRIKRPGVGPPIFARALLGRPEASDSVEVLRIPSTRRCRPRSGKRIKRSNLFRRRNSLTTTKQGVGLCDKLAGWRLSYP